MMSLRELGFAAQNNLELLRSRSQLTTERQQRAKLKAHFARSRTDLVPFLKMCDRTVDVAACQGEFRQLDLRVGVASVDAGCFSVMAGPPFPPPLRRSTHARGGRPTRLSRSNYLYCLLKMHPPEPPLPSP